MSNYANSVLVAVQDRVTSSLAICADAVTSLAWLYPLQGILYVLQHPELVSIVKGPIVSALTTSAAIVGALFFFTYIPQSLVLAAVLGPLAPLAFVASVPLLLAEAYLILTLFAKSWILGHLQERVFDEVLKKKGVKLVSEETKSVTKRNHSFKPFQKFSPAAVAEYLITLPLNAIPAVGTVIFLLINGYKQGPSYHTRYFELKKLSGGQVQAKVDQNRGAYMAFGAMALLLNLVPVIGIATSATTAAGAALWVANEEKRKK